MRSCVQGAIPGYQPGRDETNFNFGRHVEQLSTVRVKYLKTEGETSRSLSLVKPNTKCAIADEQVVINAILKL